MASIAQVRAELALIEKLITNCRVHGDIDGFELACNKRQSLQAQLAIIEEKLKERGRIGEFELDSPPGKIEKRRKRSAVVIGELAQLPLMSQGKVGSGCWVRSAKRFQHCRTWLAARGKCGVDFFYYFLKRQRICRLRDALGAGSIQVRLIGLILTMDDLLKVPGSGHQQ